MKSIKIDCQKLSNELKKLSYDVKKEELEKILKNQNLTKSRFKIKQLGKKLKKELKENVKSNHLIEAISRSHFYENWHVLNKKIEDNHLFIGKNHFECNGFVLNYDLILNYSTFDSNEERILNQSLEKMMGKGSFESSIGLQIKRDYEFDVDHSIPRNIIKLWPEAVKRISEKLDSFNFKITIDEIQKVKKFYDKEEREKVDPIERIHGMNYLVYSQTGSSSGLASSEIGKMLNYYNEHIKKEDLLAKYLEFKNKEKEFQKQKDLERKKFGEEHIFFNIWDDYSDENCGETFGQFEDDKEFLEDEEEINKVSLLIKNEILKLYPKLDIKISNNGLNFYNLDHETREELVKRLKDSKATYKGLKFYIFSES
jgi:hypothetical protein